MPLFARRVSTLLVSVDAAAVGFFETIWHPSPGKYRVGQDTHADAKFVVEAIRYGKLKPFDRAIVCFDRGLRFENILMCLHSRSIPTCAPSASEWTETDQARRVRSRQ